MLPLSSDIPIFCIAGACRQNRDNRNLDKAREAYKIMAHQFYLPAQSQVLLSIVIFGEASSS
jgi:hypothetical protein